MIENKQILVVDDNPENLKVVGNILKQEGYKIALSFGGKEALKVLENNDIDLILLDIMMPDLDGFQVCRQLKQDNRLKDIPVIFLTASNETADLVEAFSIGGIDYLKKPFLREELIARVNNHIELADSRRKILNLVNSREYLYSIIAHDIRLPLANLEIMLTRIMTEETIKTNQNFFEFLTKMSESTKNVVSLVDNLLDWTNLNSGLLEINLTINNVYSLLEENRQLLLPLAEKKGITIELLCSENCTALFDLQSMYTVIRNLLANAIKFTFENGKITLRADCEDDKVAIFVSDTGIGMTEDIINKIFKQNQPHSSFGTNNEKGSGMGFLMIKEFIEKNRGSIQVNSKPGEGTTFTVILSALGDM